MVYGGSIPTGQGRERAGRHFLKEHSLKIDCFSFLFLQVFKRIKSCVASRLAVPRF